MYIHIRRHCVLLVFKLYKTDILVYKKHNTIA